MAVEGWDRKLPAFKTLVGVIRRANGVISDAKLVSLVIPDTRRHDFHDNFRKWERGGSTPTHPESVRFFDEIGKMLQCKGMNGQRLIDCKFGEFVESLPDDLKKLLGYHDLHQSHLFRPSITVETRHLVREQKDVWLNDGHIDQLHMYQSPEAVENWKNLLRNDKYLSNVLCERSLDRLLISPEWKSLIESKGDCVAPGTSEAGDNAQTGLEAYASRHCSIIFLGCGASKKEISIIQKIDEIGEYSNTNKLHVFLNDGSFHMLMDSYIEIINSCRQQGIMPTLDIDQPLVEDFTKFTGPTVEKLRGEKGRLLFFILGNTLGNNNESRFLDSIRRVSKKGDVLVVNAEFIDNNNVEAYERSLLSNYSVPAAKDLVLGPVRTLLDEYDIPESREERRKLVNARVNGTPNFRASISNTIIVELMVELGQIDLALSISKRYDKEEFLHFFELNRFHLAFDIIYADSKSTNGQAVFLRT